MRGSGVGNSGIHSMQEKFAGIEWHIDHRGNLYAVWKYTICICQILSSFMYGYYAANKHHFAKDGITFLAVFWEVFFLIDLFINFFLNYFEFNPTGGKFLEKDLSKIATHYYKTTFWSDLIPLIPIQHIMMGSNGFQILFLLIKVSRLPKGIAKLDVVYAV